MAYRAARNGSDESGGFKLYCRGDVRVYRGDDDCTPKARKGRALLAILAAEQRPLSRTKIIDLLWSDRQEEQARASLRTLLADLKEQFNSRFEDLLVVDRERVGLGPGVRSDLTDPTLARPSGELFEGLDHIDPELDEWLRMERERWAIEFATDSLPSSRPTKRRPFGPPRWVLGLLLLVAIAAAALIYLRPWAAPKEPVVAVLKFKDLTGRNALLADGLAEELRIGLAQNPRIQVIARASSEDESVASNDVSAAASRLRATHLVEGSLRLLGRELQLNLRLIDARSERTVWTTAATASGAAVATGTNALAAQIAELLTDVLSHRAPPHTFKADDHAYSAVFSARAAMAAGSTERIAEQRGVLREVVNAHPDFVPALVALSRATMSASDHPFSRGPIPLAQARREAAHYARRAIRLAPYYAPAYDALAGAFRDMDQSLPLLRKTLSLSPGLAVSHRRLAWELEQDGDFAGALDHWRAAARLDPLSMASHVQLLRALDFSGDRQELRSTAAAFAARLSDLNDRWTFEALRAAYEQDWSRFLVSALRAERVEPDNPYTQRLLMIMLRPVFGQASARPYAGNANSFTALVLDRNTPEILRKMNEAPSDFFRLNFETAEVGDHLARAGRLEDLITTYDRARAGADPITYSDVAMVSDLLVLGLRQQGRGEEAERLLGFLESEVRKARGLRREYAAAFAASVEMLRGREDEAAMLLEEAYGNEWSLGLLNDGRPVWSAFVFEPIMNEPRIVRLRARYQREMKREADEAVREMLERGIRPARCRAIPKVCLLS